MRFKRTIRYLYDRFFEDDCANRAASLAYTTLLSLVPIGLVSFWILSIFPHFSSAGKEIQNFIFDNFIAHSAKIISDQLSIFLEKVSVLSWTNLLALIIFSILMIYDMVSAFNNIWRLRVRRNIALSFSFYSLVLLIVPIIFGLLLVISSYLSKVPLIIDLGKITFLEKPFFILLPYLAAFIVFTVFNWTLPSCHVPFRNAVLAGIFTMILFEAVKYFFGVYLRLFPTYQVIYGALAAIPIFLIWIYMSWVIILLGALVCQVLTQGIPENYH